MDARCTSSAISAWYNCCDLAQAEARQMRHVRRERNAVWLGQLQQLAIGIMRAFRSPAGASSVRPSSGRSSFTLGDVGMAANGPAMEPWTLFAQFLLKSHATPLSERP